LSVDLLAVELPGKEFISDGLGKSNGRAKEVRERIRQEFGKSWKHRNAFAHWTCAAELAFFSITNYAALLEFTPAWQW
jgi:hypothetical protein